MKKALSAIALVFILSASVATATPRDDGPIKDRSVISKIVRMIKVIIAPFDDGDPTPPKP